MELPGSLSSPRSVWEAVLRLGVSRSHTLQLVWSPSGARMGQEEPGHPGVAECEGCGRVEGF
jgi:hypothetical protein